MSAIKITFAISLLIIATGNTAFAQKRPAQLKTVIFAVLNDGKVVEPIGYVGPKGAMTKAIDGASEQSVLNSFHRTYFAKGKSYSLIFGGKSAGNITIVSSEPRGECVNFSASVTTRTTRTPLKGNIMGLATNSKILKPGSGLRRLPTPAERAEVEALVRDYFTRLSEPAAVTKDLKYHNLTAIDVNNDSNAEMVGSYWVEPSAKERHLLFFIADLDQSKKYRFGYQNSRKFKEGTVMSGDVKDVDSGIYHELLLDIFDVDGDGDSEIFSIVKGFEGAGFFMFKRKGERWETNYEGQNYHCGY